VYRVRGISLRSQEQSTSRMRVTLLIFQLDLFQVDVHACAVREGISSSDYVGRFRSNVDHCLPPDCLSRSSIIARIVAFRRCRLTRWKIQESSKASLITLFGEGRGGVSPIVGLDYAWPALSLTELGGTDTRYRFICNEAN